MASEDSFSRFVSLACHDLRTPLATVSGFAHTLQANEALGDPAARYVEMIQAASEQIAELLEDLGLVARIEGAKYHPSLVEADTLELAGRPRLGSARRRRPAAPAPRFGSIAKALSGAWRGLRAVPFATAGSSGSS